MPPRLVARREAVMDGQKMCETCNSRSQTEGRQNAIVPRDNNRELKNGAEVSSRKRQ